MQLIQKSNDQDFAAVILAAGQSKRMGQSKMVLPWRESTVVGCVISAFQKSHIAQIIVVTGGYRDLVEKEINKFRVEKIFNPEFSNGEMITSLKVGLSCIKTKKKYLFISLGDQPEIYPEDILGMMDLARNNPDKLIIPSYSMRRGHPWLIPENYFAEIKSLKSPETMKTFINRHEDQIIYYMVTKSNILADLDTPEDYRSLLSNS
jgi:molybdenum cofactor cytidylyltransferase